MILLTLLLLSGANTTVFYDSSVNITPYVELLRNYDGCAPARIDIYARNNVHYRGYYYAAQRGRISIYNGAENMHYNYDKMWVLAHELGHQDGWCRGRTLSEEYANEYAKNAALYTNTSVLA